ncbi:MAG: ABC transporter substrate-binding protein [bacterium]
MRKKPKTGQYNGNNLDKKLVSNLAKSRIPSFKQLKYINKYLNNIELIILYVAIIIFAIGIVFVGAKFYNQNLEVQPETGGKYIEGMVGSPKYINPLYSSLNDVDADISSLIYSSLFKRDIHGYLTPDLVTDYKVSPDQKSYTIAIRDDVKWHNGEDLTVDDVVFTINSFKNIQYKSPLRYIFNGVDADKINDNTIQFILKEPYAPFMEFLTFGIMPQSLWQDVSPDNMTLAELNLKPVGSGPYKFKVFEKDKNGNIKDYTLEANKDYYEQAPYLKEIVFKFFVSQEEMLAVLNNNKIDAVSYMPLAYQEDIIAPNSFNFHQLSWPWITGLFFSGKQSYNLDARKALAYAINKTELVQEALNSQAQVIDSPILSNSFAYSNEISKYSYNPAKAKELLTKLGYKLTDDKKWMAKNKKIFTIDITVADDDLNMTIAAKLAEYWEAVGIKTVIKSVPSRDLQAMAQSGNFVAMLYGYKDLINPDPYSFWHSSQRESMNIADYSNNKVDSLLEAARINNNLEARKANYAEFQKIITKELPIIFLYSSNYTYIQNKRIKGFDTDGINNPSDRFSNITNWYTKENKKFNP